MNRLSATFCPHPTGQISVRGVWRPHIRRWSPSWRSVSRPPPRHLQAPLQLWGPRVWPGVGRWLRGDAGGRHQRCWIPKLGESYPQVRKNWTESSCNHMYEKRGVWQGDDVSVPDVSSWWMTASTVKERSISRPERGKTTRATWTRKWVHKKSYSVSNHQTQCKPFLLITQTQLVHVFIQCLIPDWSTSRQNQKPARSERPSEENAARWVRLWREEVSQLNSYF